MKKQLLRCLLFASLVLPAQVSAQELVPTRTRFVLGLSAPELLHAGISLDLGSMNQVGVSAGVAPSWGSFWPSFNAEHRLYFGTLNEATNRRQWFFKQGVTKFTENNRQTALTLSVGKDLKSRSGHKGWTLDAGVFKLFQNYQDRENRIGPAVRLQYYSYFTKKKS